MSVRTKQFIIAFLGLVFLASLVFVQAMEVTRKRQEAGLAAHPVAIPVNSKSCVECHRQSTPGIIDHWKGSTHANKGVGLRGPTRPTAVISMRSSTMGKQSPRL